jgi:hypothetical protein
LEFPNCLAIIIINYAPAIKVAIIGEENKMRRVMFLKSRGGAEQAA